MQILNIPPYPQTHESATPKRISLKWTPPQKPARVDSALVSGGLRASRPQAALSASRVGQVNTRARLSLRSYATCPVRVLSASSSASVGWTSSALACPSCTAVLDFDCLFEIPYGFLLDLNGKRMAPNGYISGSGGG